MKQQKISRRAILKTAGTATAFLLSSQFLLTSSANERQNRKMIVRISRGNFDVAKYDEIAALVRRSETKLVPGVKKLAGSLNYYAAIERGSVVNVSVWDSLEHAKQMDTFAPMLALAEEAGTLGVKFEPILNYEVFWQI